MESATAVDVSKVNVDKTTVWKSNVGSPGASLSHFVRAQPCFFLPLPIELLGGCGQKRVCRRRGSRAAVVGLSNMQSSGTLVGETGSAVGEKGSNQSLPAGVSEMNEGEAESRESLDHQGYASVERFARSARSNFEHDDPGRDHWTRNHHGKSRTHA